MEQRESTSTIEAWLLQAFRVFRDTAELDIQSIESTLGFVNLSPKIFSILHRVDVVDEMAIVSIGQWIRERRSGLGLPSVSIQLWTSVVKQTVIPRGRQHLLMQVQEADLIIKGNGNVSYVTSRL
jgi:hypothetical protein